MVAGGADVAHIELVPLELIDAGDNDRKIFNDEKLLSLALDIQRNGLTSKAITVRPHPDNPGRYQIIEGERRTRAFRLLYKLDSDRFSHIPAVIRRDLTEDQADSIMFAENFHRADLDIIEEAQAYQKRMDKYGWSISDVAGELGVNEDRVRRRVKLLRLIPEAQHLVRYGNMPLKHAELLARLDRNFQLIAFGALSNPNGISEEKFRKVVDELERKQNQLALFDEDTLFYAQQPLIQERIDAIVNTEPMTTSVFQIKQNGCTITISVQHPLSSEAVLDELLIRQAVKFKKGAT